MIDTARTFGYSDAAILWKIVFPAALPFIFAAMRVALGLGMVLAVLSEMIAGLNGGYTTFDSWDARPIAEATIEAIDRLDVLAENANAAAARWPTQQGPDRLIEAILNTLE